MPERDAIVVNVADLTTRFSPKVGDLLVVSIPHGFNQQDYEQLADAVGGVIQPSGASAIFLPSSVQIVEHDVAEMGWLASEGLALRGYPVPGGEGETRFKVLHPKLGQLSDSPSHLEAIRLARIALRGGGPIPPTPLEKEPANH